MPLPHQRRRGIKVAARRSALVARRPVRSLFGLARQVYFLGTDDGGRVALYRGLPYDLPLGIDLYSEQHSIGVQASDLSAERQERRHRAQAALRGRRRRTSSTTSSSARASAPPAPRRRAPAPERRAANRPQEAGRRQASGAAN